MLLVKAVFKLYILYTVNRDLVSTLFKLKFHAFTYTFDEDVKMEDGYYEKQNEKFSDLKTIYIFISFNMICMAGSIYDIFIYVHAHVE